MGVDKEYENERNRNRTPQILIRKITVAQTLPLRSSVLWPGAPVERIHVPDDDSATHFGAFLPSDPVTPIAIISLFIDPIPEGIPIDGEPSSKTPSGMSTSVTARFRKFATSPKYQSQGIGTLLLEHVFQYARSEFKAKTIWCSARTSSLGWYERRGMHGFGDRWMKGGYEYIKMRMEL